MRLPLRFLPLLLLAWIVSTGALLDGCTDLFKPRTPQRPSEQGVLANYIESDSTLMTLKRAIEAKGASNALSAYLGGLGDSLTDGQDFFAYFDAAAAARWSNVSGRLPPDPWGVALEERFFSHLSSLSGKTFEFDWLTDQQHPNDDELSLSSKIVHRQYMLRAVPDGPGVVDTIAIGYADLTFLHSRSVDKWVIARWQDRVDPTVGANPVNQNMLSFSARRLEVY